MDRSINCTGEIFIALVKIIEDPFYEHENQLFNCKKLFFLLYGRIFSYVDTLRIFSVPLVWNCTAAEMYLFIGYYGIITATLKYNQQ
jgi:hypothetical protein